MAGTTSIAVDHELDSWFVDRAGVDKRLVLARAILAVAGLRVVVRAQDVAVFRGVASTRLCVGGLPDIGEPSEVDACIKLLDGFGLPGDFPVKVGLRCGGNHDGVIIAQELMKRLGRVAGGLVLEPYCQDPKCLWNMFNATVDYGCNVQWKLPVGDEAEYEDFYSIFNKSWILRSDGVSWQRFLTGLEAAARYGCSGVMVGRAFWSDLVDLPGGLLLKRIAQRADIIAKKLDPDGHSVGHSK